MNSVNKRAGDLVRYGNNHGQRTFDESYFQKKGVSSQIVESNLALLRIQIFIFANIVSPACS
jgi:uncharacterized protein YfaT (DUF1175 family)